MEFLGLIDFERITLIRGKGSMAKTLIAKNPSEARGIRKALRAAGIKFEFKSAGKRRRKARRNPAKKKTAKRRVRRTRSKSRRRR
jgi:hypothetical protein